MKYPPRLVLAFAATVVAACTVAQGRPPATTAAPDLAASVAQLRQHGCEGHAGAAQPLQWPAQLGEAARRVAAGEAALQAAREAGYRARKVYSIKLIGYGSTPAVARALGQTYCEAVI